jgi:hypothetical protein
MKSLSITTSEHFLNLTSPTDSSEEAQFLESTLLGRIPHSFAVVRDTSFPIRDSGPQRPEKLEVFCGVCLMVATLRRI